MVLNAACVIPPMRDRSQRCEHDLSRRVTEHLWSSNLPGLRRLWVEARRDAIVLHGTLGSYYERQVAVARAAAVRGVARVVDRLEVRG